MSKGWEGGSTRAYRKLRAFVLLRDNYQCQLTTKDICTHVGDQLHHLDGVNAGKLCPPDRAVAACGPCNNHIGDPTDTRKVHSPGARTPLVSVRSLSPELTWEAFVDAAPEWLLPYLELDANSNPPLAVSPLHPDATGTYAEAAVPWIEQVEGKTLRWWQRLGLALKLQHDSDGRLLKRVVVESAPRRAGKSVGLRGLALWRMEHGAELFGERQEIVHTGSDLAVCRKAQKEAWRWAQSHWGRKAVTRGNGKEAIESPDGDVWLVRAQDATYGWDTTLGLVDEGWDVKPETVDEGLSPSLLGRQSPQLVLTSTSHRRARSTMRSAMATALMNHDPKTLLLWWGTLPGADISDPEVWRAAAPYWDDDRREFVASMYAKAAAGESDPEFDDPDPLRGFACQFANQWDLSDRGAIERGDPVVSEDDWASLEAGVPDGPPAAAAVEGWFGDGVSLAMAWRDGERVVVSVRDLADLSEVTGSLREAGFEGRATVGASLLEDPALKGLRADKGQGRVVASVQELQRLLAEDVFRHDGGEHLSEQVLAARTMAAADGPRMVSNGAADAIKAAVWAATSARRPQKAPIVVL
ncbi:HNH endonuclease [Kribbella catacumbae]|uniref:HNH endonuclease n=1 Tax=Kribbella catacumbae TaxID=460086 RepID=UPI000374DECD|nr:HNH endonuclease [Kribbella catacumbae]